MATVNGTLVKLLTALRIRHILANKFRNENVTLSTRGRASIRKTREILASLRQKE